MITTMRRAALVLAVLAALVGTAVNFPPAVAAQSHGPVRTAVGDPAAAWRVRYPGPADMDPVAVAPAGRAVISAAHTSRPAHRSVGGIVVGVIVLALVVVTSYLLHRRRQRRFRRNEPDEPDEPRG